MSSAPNSGDAPTTQLYLFWVTAQQGDVGTGCFSKIENLLASTEHRWKYMAFEYKTIAFLICIW